MARKHPGAQAVGVFPALPLAATAALDVLLS